MAKSETPIGNDPAIGHSPLPWHTESTSICNDRWRLAYCIGQEYIVGPTLAECQANADFIVRAVNNHTSLLAACKYAEQFIEEFDPDLTLHPSLREKLRAAIEQAEL